MKKSVYALVGVVTLGGGAWVGPQEARASSARLEARMTRTNGASQTITLEGVGCSAAICSRVAVRTTADDDPRVTKMWLDRIAAIRNITSKDALFVLKNGTALRLSVVHDNQFLYFADQHGGEGKIDLAGIKSIEFLASGR